MITVYTTTDTDYESNGSAVLMPTAAKVSEEAAASYELQMIHPIDERGLWRYLVPGNIIKVPVPAAHIESAVRGENVDVWKANSAATLYASPKAPSRVQYAWWEAAYDYHVGDKVSYITKFLPDDKSEFENYQMTSVAHGTDASLPPPSSSAWTKIGKSTPGAASVTTLKADAEFYLVSEYNDYWLYVQTAKGYQGYIQKSYCSFVRTETVENEPERDITNQLFRIYNVQTDTAKKAVTLSARHVSYDIMGNLVGECVLNNASAQTAVSRMHGALYTEVESTIATNIPTELEDYSATLTWKNPVSALLDPDSGIVPHFGAKLVRDNWDFFIYENKETDRGFRIEYGKNLIGVTWKTAADKLVNRIIPVAQKADGSELLLPEIWLDSPIIDSYPVINMEQLKVDGKVGGDDGHDGTWTEEALLEHMRQIAIKRFDDGCDKAEIEIKVNFIMLGDTEEYAQYKGLQKLFLYDTVSVRDPNVGLDMALQVVSYEWDAILQRYQSITLGKVFSPVRRTVASFNISKGCVSFDKLSQDAINKIKQEVN